MKRSTLVISTLAASLLITAGPALGDNPSKTRSDEFASQKKECLLVARECQHFPTLGAKIQALKKEIAKGPDVYTKDQLRILNRELNATQGEMTDSINFDGGA